MPKMKTHKGTAKRIRFTARGKAMMRKFTPKRAKKSRSDLHEHRRDVPVHKTAMKAVRRNLPYG